MAPVRLLTIKKDGFQFGDVAPTSVRPTIPKRPEPAYGLTVPTSTSYPVVEREVVWNLPAVPVVAMPSTPIPPLTDPRTPIPAPLLLVPRTPISPVVVDALPSPWTATPPRTANTSWALVAGPLRFVVLVSRFVQPMSMLPPSAAAAGTARTATAPAAPSSAAPAILSIARLSVFLCGATSSLPSATSARSSSNCSSAFGVFLPTPYISFVTYCW